MSDHATDPATETFLAHRNLLFTVAYEMLGSAADAEDVLQETWLRWVKVDLAQVRDQRAYLLRITTRQSLNRLRTMRRRRQAYIGPWLPEPLLTAPDVAEDVELAESVSMALMLVLEQAVLGAEWTAGIVPRYGAFYGPGTSPAPGEEQFELVRERKFPLAGDGGGVWSFIHIADAAEATVAAVEHGGRGVYNIVDDDPAPVAEWLPALARILGPEQPTQAPRLAAGEAGVALMTEIRGACNARAKRELAWRPAQPGWPQGVTAA